MHAVRGKLLTRMQTLETRKEISTRVEYLQLNRRCQRGLLASEIETIGRDCILHHDRSYSQRSYLT